MFIMLMANIGSIPGPSEY